MAQHGYLREYDEGWDRGDDRERSDRDRDWRDRDRDWSDRGRDWDRGAMFGDRDRDRSDRDRGRGSDRGFFSRIGEEARSFFSDDDRGDRRDRSAWEGNRDWPQRHRGTSGYGREHGYGGFQGDYRGGREQGGFGGQRDRDEGRRNYSANPDDHYRSWRERQMQSLDRDYEDYCRDREQRFHQDFDSWRQNRQQQGSTQQSQQGGSSEEVMELDNPTRLSGEAQSFPGPTTEATLGTNNPENSTTPGRRRR